MKSDHLCRAPEEFACDGCGAAVPRGARALYALGGRDPSSGLTALSRYCAACASKQRNHAEGKDGLR